MSAALLFLCAYVRAYDSDRELIAVFRESQRIDRATETALLGVLAFLRKSGRVAFPVQGVRLFINLDGATVVVALPDGRAGLGVIPKGQTPMTQEQAQRMAADLPEAYVRADLSPLLVPLASVRGALQ